MNQETFLKRLSAIDGDDERAALLDSLCGADTLAREQLQELMSRSLSVRLDDLPTKPPGTGSTIVSPPNLIGQRLGRYEILEPLGEGGMGVVYLAQQEQPVRRRVAIKVTRPGFDSPELLARFQAERQALALMDHENIAKVFDAGATQEGRLYFVMELVDGVPITSYCEQRQLSMGARLDLFLLVCRAIQHAHQKGVVHRDVKPSNVLIVDVDGRPIPKVIDFGLAKALEKPLASQTLQTQYGQVLGTLEYMSPEQASFTTTDVDTRADVFALGVLLYELLTGTTPIGRTRLEQLELDQVFRAIREEEPVRPSVRLAAGRDEHCRSVPWDAVPSDLDLITLKALEKDRERRYDSPAALAADLERFAHDEPIDARPPSAMYLMQKFARRNRPLVAGLVAVGVTLALGIGCSTFFAISASGAAQRAQQEAEQAEVARAQETQARLAAEASAQRAENVLAVVTDAFDAVDPNSGADAAMSAKDVLLHAQQSLVDSELDPEGRAVLSQKLATCFASLGEYELAKRSALEALQLNEALHGADDPATLSAMSLLGRVHEFLGQFEDAEAVLVDALRRSEETLGTTAPETMVLMSRLATTYDSLGKMPQAISLFERVLQLRQERLGPTHPKTLSTMTNLSTAYVHSDRFQQALPLSEQVVALMQTELGTDHPETLTATDTLAGIYEALGRLDEAIPLYQDTLERTRRKLGADHPNTLTNMNNLAYTLQSAGRLDEALSLYGQVLPKLTDALGEQHMFTIATINNVASVHEDMGHQAQASQLYERAALASATALGDQHPQTIMISGSWARLLQQLGRVDEAIEKYEGIYRSCLAGLGEDHEGSLRYATYLAGAYEAAERFEEAESTLAKVLPIFEQKMPEQWPYFDAQSRYGGALLALQRVEDAEPYVRGGYAALIEAGDAIPVKRRAPCLRDALERMIRLAEAQGNADEVAQLQARSSTGP